jgi:hypothetical protein
MKIVIALILMSSLVAAQEASLTAREFRALHKDLVPKGSAAWETIPWQVSIAEARRLSVKKKKPIFLWAMNGHPLGCT